MFEERLERYRKRGQFSYEPAKSLRRCCNAPTDSAGIYIIYREEVSDDGLLYVGVSGRNDGGELKVRRAGLGGMKDRIVNGHHPKFDDKPRKQAFPSQMKKEGISHLLILWWVTYDEERQDFPTDVETELLAVYRERYGRLPPWHKQSRG